MGILSYRSLHEGFYRLKDLVQGTGVYRWLATLRAEQMMAPERLREIVSDRLRSVLEHAIAHSAYYRNLFADSGIVIDDDFDISDLESLPLLKREDLQEHYEEIVCENHGRVFPNSSGGSTGNPVNFYQDDPYKSFSQAANLLFLDWMGIRSGDRSSAIWGADRDFQDLSLRDRFFIRFDRVRALNAFSLSESRIRKFVREMNHFKPRLVFGYASALHLVARLINETEQIEFQPRAVRSSAEMLYDFQRVEIEKAFKCKVYDFYGSREVNNLAGECAAHEGLHVVSSGRILETVDDYGRPVADGKIGQVAVTDLTNFAFPFIRYLNGDMAVKSSGTCSCGRGYPLLEKIEGRVSDMIVVDGQYIHGEFFTHLFYSRPDIAQFQLIQEEPRRLRLLVVGRGEDPRVEDIIAAIRAKVGEGVTIETEIVDRISPTASGKHRFTISRIGNGS
jgi:phenylacetate-CoA ligase